MSLSVLLCGTVCFHLDKSAVLNKRAYVDKIVLPHRLPSGLSKVRGTRLLELHRGVFVVT